jgi:hypothetical protein
MLPGAQVKCIAASFAELRIQAFSVGILDDPCEGTQVFYPGKTNVVCAQELVVRIEKSLNFCRFPLFRSWELQPGLKSAPKNYD